MRTHQRLFSPNGAMEWLGSLHDCSRAAGERQHPTTIAQRSRLRLFEAVVLGCVEVGVVASSGSFET